MPTRLRDEVTPRTFRSVALYSESVRTILEGLPATVGLSGSVQVSEDATEDQFANVWLTGLNHAKTSACGANFFRGDMWIQACNRYGDGIKFMRKIYGEEKADAMASLHKHCAVVCRRVPPDQRDLTKSWWHWRQSLSHGVHTVSSIMVHPQDFVLKGKSDFEFKQLSEGLNKSVLTVSGDTVCIDTDCECGRHLHASSNRKDFEGGTQFVLMDRDTGEVL